MQALTTNSATENSAVLQLITGLGVGGAERVVMGLAGSLSEQGIRTVVVALNNDQRLLEQYSCNAFPVYHLGMAKNPWSYIKSISALIRIIRRERIALIHAHMFHALSLALACKILHPSYKIIFTSHSSKGFSLMRRMLIRMSKLLRSADVVFMPSQHSAINAANTVVIPNGVSVDLANARNTKGVGAPRVFLFVGRLEPVKNPIALVRSFSMMRHKDCELWLAGEGFMRSELEREIKAAGLEKRVRLIGMCQDVPKLLDQVDFFVMASLWEGLPMAMLEAGAKGLPVIATPVGAIPALLADDCGYLVDVCELHHAFDAVLDNYEDARQRGKRLREKVLNGYSLDHMTKTHLELYASLLTAGQL